MVSDQVVMADGGWYRGGRQSADTACYTETRSALSRTTQVRSFIGGGPHYRVLCTGNTPIRIPIPQQHTKPEGLCHTCHRGAIGATRGVFAYAQGSPRGLGTNAPPAGARPNTRAPCSSVPSRIPSAPVPLEGGGGGTPTQITGTPPKWNAEVLHVSTVCSQYKNAERNVACQWPKTP